MTHSESDLRNAVCKKCKCKPEQLKSISILRKSIDARKKPQLFVYYTVVASFAGEEKLLQRLSGDRDVSVYEDAGFTFPKAQSGDTDPVYIIGDGPAGLFCAYELAHAGFHPIVLERGGSVEERTDAVEKFWKSGELDLSTNVQFGEGGAGTFSDGKLNTLVKDRDGRHRHVLETFVQFGAPPDIVYDYKPHIGTDVLRDVIRRMRQDIEAHGGEIRFHSQVTKLLVHDQEICGLVINDRQELTAGKVVLAIGHSARDTFLMLHRLGVPMEAKAFAVGYRVMHPQEWVNRTQYGLPDVRELGAAPYKVTAKSREGRGVYSFCMCPGGYVVNASSEAGRLAVNGMSYSGRDSGIANSALIVAVTPDDYVRLGLASDDPEEILPEELSGIAFQRALETRAYRIGEGKVPIQKYGIFKKELEKRAMIELGEGTDGFDAFAPMIKGRYTEADLTDLLPMNLQLAFAEGMESIDHKMPGFACPETVLCGIESRTSSPVRIHRNDCLQTAIKGLYPCGEGAGYAGGITSAAMDGIRVAMQLAEELS